eukprot:TRINITY_DN24717_c0_g1_i1.p1 TRINITY_DN24717_c0_g1~~TRINITY_DN24717_c0_g1_i1.p1  ORF type:complete len:859 (+),score=204.25 TRINITY_DN24717_c0_g1_i1:56-2632(+)
MYRSDEGTDEVQEFGQLLEELDQEISDVLLWKPVPQCGVCDRQCTTNKRRSSFDSLGDIVAVDVSRPEPISDVTEVTINSNGLSISHSGSTEHLDYSPYRQPNSVHEVPARHTNNISASKPPVRVTHAAKRVPAVRRVLTQADIKTVVPSRYGTTGAPATTTTVGIPLTTKEISATYPKPTSQPVELKPKPTRPDPKPAVELKPKPIRPDPKQPIELRPKPTKPELKQPIELKPKPTRPDPKQPIDLKPKPDPKQPIELKLKPARPDIPPTTIEIKPKSIPTAPPRVEQAKLKTRAVPPSPLLSPTTTYMSYSLDLTSPVNTMDDMMASQSSVPTPEPELPSKPRPVVPPLKTSIVLQNKLAANKNAPKPLPKTTSTNHAVRKPSASGNAKAVPKKPVASDASKALPAVTKTRQGTKVQKQLGVAAPTASAAAKMRPKKSNADAPVPAPPPRPRGSTKSTASPSPAGRTASPASLKAASPMRLPRRKSSEPPVHNTTSASPLKSEKAASPKVASKRASVQNDTHTADGKYIPSYMRPTASTPPKKEKYMPLPPIEDDRDGRDIFDTKVPSKVPRDFFDSKVPSMTSSKATFSSAVAFDPSPFLSDTSFNVRPSIPNTSITSIPTSNSVPKESAKKKLKPVCNGDTYKGVFVNSVPVIAEGPPRVPSTTLDDFRVFDISSPSPSPALLPKGFMVKTKPDAPPVMFARSTPPSSRKGSISSVQEDVVRMRPPSAVSVDSTGTASRRPPLMRSVASSYQVSPTVGELKKKEEKPKGPVRRGGPKAPPPRGQEHRILSLEEARKHRRMQRDALSTPTGMKKLARLEGARQWAPGEGRRVQRGSQDFKGARRARLNSSPIVGF